MRNVWVIARREYNRFFASPIAYVLAILILLLLGLYFAAIVYYSTQNAFGGGGSAPDATPINSLFVALMVFTIPILTMRLVSEENHTGTIELLLTAPLRNWELISGKWLGGLLYMLTLIGITLIDPLILNNLVSPGIDQSLFMTSYLGVILVAATLLAVGVGISSLFTNQIAALIVTYLVFLMLWWALGIPAQLIPSTGGEVFGYLTIANHFDNSMNGGTINLSDLAYYLSLIALGLFMGTAAVETRRWS